MSAKFTSSSSKSLSNVVKITTTQNEDGRYRTVINVHGPDFPDAAAIDSQLERHCTQHNFPDLRDKLSYFSSTPGSSYKATEIIHDK